MPAAKYEAIYRSLCRAVEEGEFRRALPPEHILAERYGCSRNTVRRAVRRLAEEGYVQSVHGKGVLILGGERETAVFSMGGIETLGEAAARNGMEASTRVVHFTELCADAAVSRRTGFPVGSELYYLIRVRLLNGEPLILDHNWFLKSVVRGLTPAIAEGSVYGYMEQTLGEMIVTARRKYTVERRTKLDAEYLDLKGFNCLAVVSSQAFNRDGVMFEFTRSRHRPDRFVFYDLARRRKPADG